MTDRTLKTGRSCVLMTQTSGTLATEQPTVQIQKPNEKKSKKGSTEPGERWIVCVDFNVFEDRHRSGMTGAEDNEPGHLCSG